MHKAKTSEAPYRFGEWGPGYIARGPRTDIGVCRLRPGDTFPNHYHRGLEETFVVLEGQVTLWSNCEEKFTLQEGDLHRCDPYEMHYFVNEADRPWRALFIKAPFDAEDTVVVEWAPGEPVPQIDRSE